MTTAEALPAAKQQIPLPWVFGAIAFIIYCLTLNHWVSLSSIGSVSRVSGWTWQPQLRQPLTGALLYPFHFLPQAWVPFAVNFLDAACAALVITLLARSISLLGGAVGTPSPTSATSVGRGVPIAPLKTSWLPPMLAATVCGLQLTFWEHATAFTGEMLDLLVFACVIRCLLEFRNDQREFWLYRSAVIYGAGITNNWAMIGYLPLYLVAILLVKNFGLKRASKPSLARKPRQRPQWLRDLLAKIGIRQSRFPKPVYPKFQPVEFDTGFFLRMVLWGLAGLSFYLLLPLAQIISSHSSVDFWSALRANLTSQKNSLIVLRSSAFRILAIASLLPILVLVIGWKSLPANSGYETRRAIFLNRVASYPLHAFVLFIALWLSFDPVFSPRHYGIGLPMLSYYYLSAMMVGYCAAYFLQLAAQGVSKSVGRFIAAGICTLVVALPVLLVTRNLGNICLTNGPAMRQFAREMYADLPDGKSVVLGNDLAQLSILRAEIGAQGHAKDALVVELPSLNSAQYHLFMARQYGPRWPVIPPTNAVDLTGPIKLLKLIANFHEPVVYLDPSFGALFDRPNDAANGFIHRFATKPEPQAPAKELVWQRRWESHLQVLAAHTKTQPTFSPQWLRPVLSTLRLRTEPNATAAILGVFYSRSLNHFGVKSQRAGNWPQAGVWFGRSLELNPQNLSAHINWDFNEQWQRGNKTRLNPSLLQKKFGDISSRYKDWREILSEFGPVDEPTFLFRTGRAFLANGNTRLAAHAFQRSAVLAPEWPLPELWLAQSLIEQGDFAEALHVTDGLASDNPPQEGPGLAQFLHCRATGLQGAGRTNEILSFIDGFVRDNGKHNQVLAAAANAYAENGMHEQQLATIEELLKREPNRPEWLSQKGVAEMQLGRYEAAIATLTTALSIAPTDENARLTRAIARLGADQLDPARDDYQQLLNSKTCAANALFGLGTIAWRKHETNSAIHFYQQYLTNVIPGSPQVTVASQRLRELSAVDRK